MGVPSELVGEKVEVRLSLEGEMKVFSEDRLVASHRLKRAFEGWSTVPAHHRELWERVSVHTGTLEEYEEVSQWNS